MRWHTQERWKDRLIAEEAAMRKHFPQFVLRLDSGNLCWDGIVEPIPGNLFHITIRYRDTHPYTEPETWIDPPPPPGTPHVYCSGAICIHKQTWDPATGTAASLVPLVCGWLTAFVHWQEAGERF
jgi:hypothetical protein